jgi:hypothetical protein
VRVIGQPPRRRRFLVTLAASLLALPLGRVFLRRRRRKTAADLAPIPWIGHC